MCIELSYEGDMHIPTCYLFWSPCSQKDVQLPVKNNQFSVAIKWLEISPAVLKSVHWCVSNCGCLE